MAFDLYKQITTPDEITSDVVFSTAYSEVKSLSPDILKAKENGKIRQSLQELKASIADIEAALGEAL